MKNYPPRLTNAFKLQQNLKTHGIYFAPIRHHSPACSFALLSYIKSINPTHILIEAPHSFNALIPDLLSSDTKPPIAIFNQATQKNKIKSPKKETAEDDDNIAQERIYSAFFPFCEYSPEWVALKESQRKNIPCEFIDLDFASLSQLENEFINEPHNTANQAPNQKSLMQERYLAHSTYISTLAKRLHLRDHDDLWEHLFELQPPDKLNNATDFFNDVLAWCALARLDYEEEVLLKEGSLHREYCMIQKIMPLIDKNHKLLIVTGGFHTLALIENLHKVIHKEPIKPYIIKNTYDDNAWLIRYSFDRLNALNGYASGMPSPAYYEWRWQTLLTFKENQKNNQDDLEFFNQEFYAYVLTLCHQLNDKSALEITPFIALKNTLEIATGLSALRGHYTPSRYDLIDGITTALTKGELDDGQAYLWQVVYEHLSGNKLGQVAKTQKSPALVANTYQKAQYFRFKLDDTLPKTRKLDTYRKPLHRQISQFMHLLYFLEVGFGQFMAGADFVSGTNLDLLFEEWRYAWTPSVEARLIELSETGNDLAIIATQKLLNEKTHLTKTGTPLSANDCAKLFAKACKMGLKSQMTAFNQELKTHLHSDYKLTSLIGATAQLFYLWQGRALIDIDSDLLKDNMMIGIRQSIYCLNTLYDTTPENTDEHLTALIRLNELIKNTAISFNLGDEFLNAFYDNISHDELIKLGLYSLAGALYAMAYLDNKIGNDDLQNAIITAFATGTLPSDSVLYLQGIFKVTPEYFIGSPIAIHALNELIKRWNNELFLSLLPDLRFIFSTLTPRQSQEIAKRIAHYTGLSDDDEVFYTDLSISENEMMYGVQLNEKLTQLLNNDCLG